jgi:hypothetical protein
MIKPSVKTAHYKYLAHAVGGETSETELSRICTVLL